MRTPAHDPALTDLWLPGVGDPLPDSLIGSADRIAALEALLTSGDLSYEQTHLFNRSLLRERVVASPLSYAMHCTAGTSMPTIPFRWVRLLNRRLLDLAARRGNRFLIVTVPVRHGKSYFSTTWFPAWYLGHFPDHQVVIGCYNKTFAGLFGERVRSIVRTANTNWFGTQVSSERSAKNDWKLADPHAGGCISVGVGIPPTGRGGDCVIIDDPIKSDKEAYSKVYRDDLFRWWQFSIRTRLEPGAICIIIMSRWHHDDLVGRLVAAQESGDLLDSDGNPIDRFEVLHLPAIADPAVISPDPLGRDPGEALCPERYDAPALRGLRDNPATGVGSAAFAALYQGVPNPPGGDVFPEDQWVKVRSFPPGMRLFRRWDLAGTEGAGDWTAGVLMGFDETTRRAYVLDARRRQTSNPLLFMIETARDDLERWGCSRVRMARDPAQAGKLQGTDYAIRVSAAVPGVHFRALPETGSPDVRIIPWQNAQNNAAAYLLEGPWNKSFVDEHTDYPNGKNDDLIMAAANGYAEAAGLTKARAAVL